MIENIRVERTSKGYTILLDIIQCVPFLPGNKVRHTHSWKLTKKQAKELQRKIKKARRK